MKKKGFTLIELLAVIVILAIIALIATPLVLKYIETARTNSKITSTQNYMKAVENALASYSITNKVKSYPEGCYEISTLNTDLDISMKGNMPSEGKVCIEDNKIKKSMVKYSDNKVIKYEDNKSTISDEETYESFNSVSNYIIDADVEFVYDDNEGAYIATLPITKEIANKFEIAINYDFIIDNEIITMSSLNTSLGFMIHSDLTYFPNMTWIIVNEEELTFFTSIEITGVHNIKIGNHRPVEERVFFHVEEDGNIAITGYDFVLGNAKILIKNEEGTEYYNNTIELIADEGAGIIGASSVCRNNLPELPEIYIDLINGKTITIEITQTIEDKDIVSSISRNLDSMYDPGDEGIYFSSPHILSLYAMTGC